MAPDSNEATYRKKQIEFVSNTHGTTARETLLLLMPSVCSLLLMVTVTSLVGRYLNRLTKFVLEFVVILIPSILCCTIYSEAKVSVCAALLAMSCTNLLLVGVTKDLAKSGGAKSSVPTGRRPFITNFRALTSILTAICILAVDFKAFPRSSAKTEIYGYSLMDTGVGFFVMANAVVSPEARDTSQQGNRSGFVRTVFKNFFDSVRSCIPLLVLGSGRYFSVEYLNYQRQVTEYGVHWNFFITLAAVKILTTVVTSLISSKHSLLIGVSILASYEYILSHNSVRQWLFGYSREGFIDANREGIASTLGYVGLYFIGVAIGRLIHSTYKRAGQTETNASQDSTNFRFIIFEAQYSVSMILCVKLSLIAAQACAATLFLDSYLRVSRKLANAGYCAWMVTLTTVMLTLLLLIDVVADILRQLVVAKETNSNKKKSKKEKDVADRLSSTPDIFEAVNYNGLAFFLVSNLLTGAINMSMKTLYVADLEAVKIITAYMVFGTALFGVLYRYKIQIKL